MINENFILEFEKFLEKNRSRYYYGFDDSFYKVQFSLKKALIIECLRNSNYKEIDSLWKILLFSLSSKFIYNYSKANYRLICDYYYNAYDFNGNILKFIYGQKLKFVDELTQGLNLEDFKLYYQNCNSKVDHYVDFFISVLTRIDQDLFNVKSIQNLKTHLYDDYFKEEFSNKDGDLTNMIFKTLENKLKHI
jgi:hypothetical protein